jgi:hypothetical protein
VEILKVSEDGQQASGGEPFVDSQEHAIHRVSQCVNGLSEGKRLPFHPQLFERGHDALLVQEPFVPAEFSPVCRRRSAWESCGCPSVWPVPDSSRRR